MTQERPAGARNGPRIAQDEAGALYPPGQEGDWPGPMLWRTETGTGSTAKRADEMMAMPSVKPAWESIALEYETAGDEVTLAALARAHGIPAGTVRNRAYQGKWAERRNKYRDNLVTQIRQKIRDLQVREVERDYKRLQDATTIIDTAISAGTLEPNSLDSAIATLISLVKAKEVLGGGGASDRTAAATPTDNAVNLDEIRERLSESVHVLSVVLAHESQRESAARAEFAASIEQSARQKGVEV